MSDPVLKVVFRGMAVPVPIEVGAAVMELLLEMVTLGDTVTEVVLALLTQENMPE